MMNALALEAHAEPRSDRLWPDDEARQLAALRNGDESAFVALIEAYQGGMLRVAMAYVHDWSLAEDVVQEAWLGVLRGLDRFQARSSLKTWILRIVVNIAKTHAARQRREIPLVAEWEPAVEPDHFLGANAPRWPGHWAVPPTSWGDDAEERLMTAEAHGQIRAAIDALPASQRSVVFLRDAEGWTAAEVCHSLQISEANQRVLLHRGRCRVRRALEQLFADADDRRAT